VHAHAHAHVQHVHVHAVHVGHVHVHVGLTARAASRSACFLRGAGVPGAAGAADSTVARAVHHQLLLRLLLRSCRECTSYGTLLALLGDLFHCLHGILHSLLLLLCRFGLRTL
jgi:hypothetical protein